MWVVVGGVLVKANMESVSRCETERGACGGRLFWGKGLQR